MIGGPMSATFVTDGGPHRSPMTNPGLRAILLG